MPTSVPAQESVLATPELFEAILLQLPIRDLLISAQRVNHTWKASIDSSVLLQQKLFFQLRTDAPGSIAEFNPLLQKAFPWWFGIKPMPEEVKKRGDGRKRIKPFAALKWNTTPEIQSAFSRREASWRRMLPIRSPARYMYLWKLSHYQGGSTTTDIRHEFKDGIRMGLLYDLAHSEVSIPLTSFEIIWHMNEPAEEMPPYFIGKNKTPEIPHSQAMTMTFSYTAQCIVGMQVMPDGYASEGAESVDFIWEGAKTADDPENDW